MDTHTSAVKTVPKSIDDLYQKYQLLHVPYFRSDRSLQLKRRVFKGKGNFEEIESELMLLQSKNPESKDNATLLASNKIGIDCSGFISHLYDVYTLETYKKHVWEFYTRSYTNPLQFFLGRLQPIVSMLDAKTLCSDRNTMPVISIKDVKPMDLIQFSGGRHVGMIYNILTENGKVSKIDFIHSTEGVGITKNSILITDDSKSIFNQTWQEKSQGAKYSPEYLIRYTINKNGIRRPNFLT